ncbi:lipoprotein NlpD [Amphritea atlantica]|uniref:Lipoprotein NlpD n=1 Tax=Amphritea atlantica TaxID=355243 RepID=A0A1H9K970_9GAMM|nr:peptidoglycan DD-metalloendopeptidase family protein [Amphritea atlantica]SEQ95681.1 lipoprotein NlpD [Amphritea atlantica]
MVRAVADILSAPALFAVVLMLSACSSTSLYTPVDERSISGRHPVKVVSSQTRPGQYRVRRGDTLYSIAFRYGLDFRQLARTNGISDRYEIFPGQLLELKETPPDKKGPRQVVAVAQPASSATPVKSARPVKAVVAQKKVSPPAPVAQKTRPKAAPVVVKKMVEPVADRALKWRWPASGKIIDRFSNKGTINKGINFAGSKGEPVFAAESGKVVYAGSGLLGYGNLVIIHHNQKFLSAYAHNSRILVKENDKVKIGDKIAEIGNSGAARTMLHFEIRRDGQPVDPMMYLPRKR